MARTVPGVFVLDTDRVSAEVGYESWHDSKTWYLARAPLSVRASKAMVYEAAARGRAAYTAGDRLFEPVYRSADAQEGPRAFREKRAPDWKAR